MNQAITGAWAKQRSRISLNVPAPPRGSAAAAAASRAESKGDASQEDGASRPDVDASTGGKRKSRSMRSSTGAKRSRRGGSERAEEYPAPSTRLCDLGGVAGAIEKALELVAMPICHPEIYTHTGVTPPRGVLFHGPPGCGKTMMAGALAGELGVPFLSVSAPAIVSGTSGESEKTLRDTFEEAQRIAPCILFIDEIDAITPKRETAQREMERRIVAQLLTCLDDLAWEKSEDGRPVMVLGATNRPDSLDPALRRAGRFDHEIGLGVPDERGREQILRVLCARLRLAGDFDFRYLAKRTPGFVGADLTSLTSAAGIAAVKRIFQELGRPDALPAVTDAPMVEDARSARDSGAPAADSANESHGDTMNCDPEEAASANGACGEATSAEGTPADGTPAEAAFDAASADVAVSASADLAPTRVHTGPQLIAALPESVRHTSIAAFLVRFPHPLPDTELERLAITNQDFLDALAHVQPSSKREGFATVPDVSWDDIGALHQIREELSMAIVQPIRRPELFHALGVDASCGVLLWGPPGCGKTLLAKAVANESRANFISIKGPELLNKYVGESEKAVRQVFARARASSPCVIFFDELDALVPRREESLSESSARVVNTLLTELDGLEPRVQTYVIAATNRPDMIDPAMCRPGRLDKLLYVDFPSPTERLDILRTLTKSSPLAHTASDSLAPVDLEAIALDRRADGFSGADIAALVREAAVSALRERLSASLQENEVAPTEHLLIHQEHFLRAFNKVLPSVTRDQRRRYESLRGQLASDAMVQAVSAARRVSALHMAHTSIHALGARPGAARRTPPRWSPSMPAYHSTYNEEPNVRQVASMSLLPFRTKTRGPAPPPVDPARPDIVDEAIDLFRANTLFRNYEIKGPADRVLVYLSLFINDCLSRIAASRVAMPKNEALKQLSSHAVDGFSLPGDANFPLNSLYSAPSGRAEADMLRQYLSQARQETVLRLLDRIYENDVPSRWWLAFTKRKLCVLVSGARH